MFLCVPSCCYEEEIQAPMHPQIVSTDPALVKLHFALTPTQLLSLSQRLESLNINCLEKSNY